MSGRERFMDFGSGLSGLGLITVDKYIPICDNI